MVNLGLESGKVIMKVAHRARAGQTLTLCSQSAHLWAIAYSHASVWPEITPTGPYREMITGDGGSVFFS